MTRRAFSQEMVGSRRAVAIHSKFCMKRMEVFLSLGPKERFNAIVEEVNNLVAYVQHISTRGQLNFRDSDVGLVGIAAINASAAAGILSKMLADMEVHQAPILYDSEGDK